MKTLLTILFSCFLSAYAQFGSPTYVSVDVNSKTVCWDSSEAGHFTDLQIWIVRVRQGVTEWRDGGYIPVYDELCVTHSNALNSNELKRTYQSLFFRGGGDYYYQYQLGSTQSPLIQY